ncbi:integral membrane protein [Moniliophthora roreri]|uniref:Uncharacterized protein n=1 Tax=Moniliophthora roreri TaxID=221103 RepID=A0A0W0FJ14_MONRR|nr:integral membrane protein [Moniliophthora roreri]
MPPTPMLSSMPPALEWPLQFCAFVTATTYILSIVTSNVSQVDRLWTFLPNIYTAYYALLPILPKAHEQPFFLCPYVPPSMEKLAEQWNPRALLMLGLVTTWMLRLSYNTYRRGLFSLKDEDYRWAVLRTQLSPFLFQVTNLTFIAITQNILLFFMGIPAYIAASQPPEPLATSDYALATLASTLLVLEFTSDNQQFSYQSYKAAHLKGGQYNAADHWPGARLQWTPADAQRGFITRGLFAYSRHPNFACEQAFWWTISLFPLLAPSAPSLTVNYSVTECLEWLKSPSFTADLSNPATWPIFLLLLPAACYSILFFSSTPYTESITTKKYAAYKDYQCRVGMFSPIQTFEKAIWLWITQGSDGKKAVEAKVWGAGVKGKGKAE